MGGLFDAGGGVVVEEAPFSVARFEARQQRLHQRVAGLSGGLLTAHSVAQIGQIFSKGQNILRICDTAVPRHPGGWPVILLHRVERFDPSFGGGIDQIRNVLLPQHVATEHDVGVRDPYNGIAACVAGIISNVDSARAQVEFDVAVVDHGRQSERLHARLLLGRHRRIEHLDVLGAHPGAHVAVRHDGCAGSGKHVVPVDVVQVIMRVDDKADRQRRELANLGEQRLRGARILEGIDHQNAVVADHESRVSAGQPSSFTMAAQIPLPIFCNRKSGLRPGLLKAPEPGVQQRASASS